MAKIAYRTNRLSKSTLLIIELANVVIGQWSLEYGYDTMTARQIYYQFIAQDLFPNSMPWLDPVYNRKNGLDSETKNTMKNYKKLCEILVDGRYNGMIDWDVMVDETRDLESVTTWSSPGSILRAVAAQYHTDRWKNQTYRPEVWIEKDAAQIILRPVCDELFVPHSSCRGYGSASAFKVAAERLVEYNDNGQIPIILHIGDHDPSGKDMSRDIAARVEEFAGFEIEVRRLALNMDQVNTYSPPPNPAKITDPRAKSYIEEFGDESWELDALRPNVLTAIARDEIESLIDRDAWTDSENEEREEKQALIELSRNWEHVKGFLKGDNGDDDE